MTQTTKGRVRYVGPFPEGVHLRLPDAAWSQLVAHGDVFTTTRDHAASLLEQSDNWESADEKDGEK